MVCFQIYVISFEIFLFLPKKTNYRLANLDTVQQITSPETIAPQNFRKIKIFSEQLDKNEEFQSHKPLRQRGTGL